jgi:ubiquinone/menaquinone biosynthesis C-methylase UbiE
MFVESAELYDAIYHFKNYARECERLRTLIGEAVPAANTILDVACGTGEHARFLKEHYAVDGVDINENYLRAARLKNPAGNYTRADMTDFDLGRNLRRRHVPLGTLHGAAVESHRSGWNRRLETAIPHRIKA